MHVIISERSHSKAASEDLTGCWHHHPDNGSSDPRKSPLDLPVIATGEL